MALTLRSSTSFLNLKDPKGLKLTTDASPSTACFPQAKPQRRYHRATVMMAAATLTETGTREWVHAPVLAGSSHESKGTRVPVYVMMPLDTVGARGGVNRARAVNASLMALKSAGVEGVMVDVWWGLVERDGPSRYDWAGYAELVQMVQRNGLKLQVVMSFHQCGGNVGDSCCIPLPPWVLEVMNQNPDIVYTDRSGRRNPEYISLGCDSLPVLRGRTPVQVYADFMRSFRDRFADYLGDVIVEIQVGMGPCGELRYPAYPEANGTWRFPGVGEFQCYDKYMRASLAASAEAIGKKDWGNSGPHDSGQYNQFPEDTGFFRRDGTWSTEYGQFFLQWYSEKLVAHGDVILNSAKGIFRGTGAKLSGKIAGIHWHYKTRSHAAELTAGYYNTRDRNGYQRLAQMFAKHDVVFNFTCMEMKDGEQPGHANCSPEGLVQQVKGATRSARVELAGENALERYDARAFGQVLATSRSGSGNGLCAFTYLRMNKRLFESDNWRNLVEFVKSMNEGGCRRLSECDSTGTDLFVGFVREKVLGEAKEAALG